MDVIMCGDGIELHALLYLKCKRFLVFVAVNAESWSLNM